MLLSISAISQSKMQNPKLLVKGVCVHLAVFSKHSSSNFYFMWYMAENLTALSVKIGKFKTKYYMKKNCFIIEFNEKNLENVKNSKTEIF